MLLWLSSIENTRREQPFPGYGAARGTAAGEARYAFAVPLCRQKTLSRKRQFRRAETAFPLFCFFIFVKKGKARRKERAC